MKKRHLLSLFLIAPVVAFFAGPRPTPDLTVKRPAVPRSPEELDGFLSASEARFDELTPGTEKTIIWSDSTNKRRMPLSVVYLHGFSASRQETAPLSDFVARAVGANLFYTRLTGHGLPGDALGDASVNDWINDAIEALEVGHALGEEVVVIGTSTGATLATWVLSHAEFQANVRANIMISPNFAPKDRSARVALWPWGRQIIRAAIGKLRRWEPRNAKQEKYWTTVYPVDAIVTMMSLVDVVDETDLSTLRTPTLVLYAELDDVISVDKIKERFVEIGAARKDLVAVDTSSASDSHVIAGDIVSPARTQSVADQIVDWLATL